MTSTVIDDFIERAQRISVTEAATTLQLPVRKGDKGGPCPRCGGKDRFSINTVKQAWHCRGCDTGGKTGINLAGHVLQIDLHSRAGLLEACAAILGEAIPDGGERETEAERAARQARMDESRRKAAADDAKREQGDNAFREKAVSRARGIYLNARPAEMKSAVADYLHLRTGFFIPAEVFDNIRMDERHTYWHGVDDHGYAASYHVGWAMIAPFVNLTGRITGAHETWIDLQNGPKYRPDLGRDEKGNPLPTKKMQGTKKGSFIPLCGDTASTRWMAGEGIETVLAVAGVENFRSDTFYCATGDLGNLAGPADPKSAFAHPTLMKPDVNGKPRAVRVPGPTPKADQAPDEAFQIPDHVDELVLPADGDSELVFTAAAMARAEARLCRAKRTIHIWWPPEGDDFAGVISKALLGR